MENFLHWTGVILSLLCYAFGAIILVVLGIRSIDDIVRNKKLDNRIAKSRKFTTVFAVKIPTPDKLYTPVAYFYERKGRDQPPVVTLLIPNTLLRKIPDNTPVFTLDDKPDNGIQTIWHIKKALTAYTKSIKT